MKKMILAFLLCCSFYGNTWADSIPAENVIFPKHGDFSLANPENANPGLYHFNGSAEIRGQLEVGWIIYDVLESGEIQHELQIIFIPEQSETALLPRLKNDVYNTQAGPIYLYDVEPEKFVRRHFSDIPKDFFKNEEGILSMPVHVVIEDYLTYVEGDCRYFEAKFISIKPLNEPLKNLVEKQCSGLNFAQDMYMTKSNDGYVNLRTQASSQSEVLQQLPNDVLLTKIETQGNWFLVSLMETPEVKGFVHKSQVVGAN